MFPTRTQNPNRKLREFGVYQNLPGLHFLTRIDLGLDEVTIIPLKKQMSERPIKINPELGSNNELGISIDSSLNVILLDRD